MKAAVPVAPSVLLKCVKLRRWRELVHVTVRRDGNQGRTEDGREYLREGGEYVPSLMPALMRKSMKEEESQWWRKKSTV